MRKAAASSPGAAVSLRGVASIFSPFSSPVMLYVGVALVRERADKLPAESETSWAAVLLFPTAASRQADAREDSSEPKAVDSADAPKTASIGFVEVCVMSAVSCFGSEVAGSRTCSGSRTNDFLEMLTVGAGGALFSLVVLLRTTRGPNRTVKIGVPFAAYRFGSSRSSRLSRRGFASRRTGYHEKG